MTDAAMRMTLEAMLRETDARLSGRPVERPGNGDDGDLARQAHDEHVDHASREHLVAHRRAIVDALVRMDAGEFGVCVSCSRRIAPARLAAVPFATRCVRCQEAEERRA